MTVGERRPYAARSVEPLGPAGPAAQPPRRTGGRLRTRSIAFYLPQYHPIPENDEWWGPGFTEWTNVVKGRPRFPGHHQPHLPADLGFYDLRLPDAREGQAALARDHGVDAFCYYHYWFGGRRLLERPFDEVLASGRPDFPFLLCWANENWTRRWDGQETSVLVRQSYGDDDARHHGRWLARAFSDERYVRLDGRPLFLVYAASAMDSPRRTTRIWRDEARKAGVGEIYLCRVESNRNEHTDPAALGFDAAVEFAPDWTVLAPGWRRLGREVASRAGLVASPLVSHQVHQYGDVARRMLAKPTPAYRRFPCVTPGWDNTARRDRGAAILDGSSPDRYGGWLRGAAEAAPVTAGRVAGVRQRLERVGEGCHLEPCQRWGRQYLEAHRAVMLAVEATRVAEPAQYAP